MLLNEIRAIVADLTVIPPDSTAPGYLFGTAKEINNYTDKQTVWPLVAHYPMSSVDVVLGKNGSADNYFNLYIEFLYPTKFEKDSAEDEPLIENARRLANRFLVTLMQYKAGPNEPAFFKLNVNDRPRMMPCYNKHDVNTVGIGLTLKVKVRLDEYLLPC